MKPQPKLFAPWVAGEGGCPFCRVPEGWPHGVNCIRQPCEHDWDYETKTCLKCGKVAERLMVDINWPHKVSEF